MGNAIAGDRAALDDFGKPELSTLRNGVIARERRLYVSIDQQDANAKVRQQCAKIGAERGFTHPTLRGYYGDPDHL
ncbi:hypothetical protein SDC9_199275 [bioreactor metagenome]|uniref:Uncharacterized protein n=1 Tax=bioreactor metagenome TaxID=1076179 RepID=A0A645IKS7_9ZZZZ